MQAIAARSDMRLLKIGLDLSTRASRIDCDYENGTVDISMPGYYEKALRRFQHTAPAVPKDAPHALTPPTFGAAVQYAKPKRRQCRRRRQIQHWVQHLGDLATLLERKQPRLGKERALWII
jgi:hypothetical protein